MIDPRNRLLRFLLLGPTAGAFAATSNTCGALIVWVLFGEPDFYFRGWNSVPLSFILGSIIGARTGIIYGLLLTTFEILTRRTVRISWLLVNLAMISFLASVLVAYIEIKAFVEVGRLSQVPIWWEELFSIVVCCILGPMLSKRITPNQQIQETPLANCS